MGLWKGSGKTAEAAAAEAVALARKAEAQTRQYEEDNAGLPDNMLFARLAEAVRHQRIHEDIALRRILRGRGHEASVINTHLRILLSNEAE